jgi:hypothetical protein
LLADYKQEEYQVNVQTVADDSTGMLTIDKTVHDAQQQRKVICSSE